MLGLHRQLSSADSRLRAVSKDDRFIRFHCFRGMGGDSVNRTTGGNSCATGPGLVVGSDTGGPCRVRPQKLPQRRSDRTVPEVGSSPKTHDGDVIGRTYRLRYEGASETGGPAKRSRALETNELLGQYEVHQSTSINETQIRRQ